jgi:hypothetical protein
MSFVKVAQRLGRVLARGLITPEEYATNLVEGAALLEAAESDVVDLVVASIPLIARDAVTDVIKDVLRADYRIHALHYGGRGPSQAERESIRDVYTERIRAFAAALARALQRA